MRGYMAPYARVLSIVQPDVVQEWGPGPNTSMALALGSTVHSFEHDPAYSLSSIGRLHCHCVGVDTPEYTQAIPADLYFVDGRRRADCIRSVRDKADGAAVLCLHDAQRIRYHEALARFDNVIFLTKGFAVASMGWDLSTFAGDEYRVGVR